MAHSRTSRRIGRPQSAQGFTLIEMLVAVLISSMVLLALLGIFDFTDKLARAQTQITDVQQSLRTAQYDVVRLIRMAGRGPLPLRTTGKSVPTGLAVEVLNGKDLPVGTQVGYPATEGPVIEPLTDILVVRGVFGSSLFQVNHVDPASFTQTATGGTVTFGTETPTGVPHNLDFILQTICDDIKEALVLVSPLDDAIFAVVELDHAATKGGITCPPDPSTVTTLTLAFKSTGSTYTDAYRSLSPNGVFPAALTSVAFVGVLEEHRFYIRMVLADPNDQSSNRIPRFSRARLFPGSATAYLGDDSQWRNDIADNIFDLQVALGLDGNNDGLIADQDDGTDEWLFNHPSDDATEARWNLVQPAGATPQGTRLFNLRLTTVARTARKDQGYQAPLLGLVEDHDYSVAPSTYYNLFPERTRRQRQLRTVIDMRNVS